MREIYIYTHYRVCLGFIVSITYLLNIYHIIISHNYVKYNYMNLLVCQEHVTENRS